MKIPVPVQKTERIETEEVKLDIKSYKEFFDIIKRYLVIKTCDFIKSKTGNFHSSIMDDFKNKTLPTRFLICQMLTPEYEKKKPLYIKKINSVKDPYGNYKNKIKESLKEINNNFNYCGEDINKLYSKFESEIKKAGIKDDTKKMFEPKIKNAINQQDKDCKLINEKINELIKELN